MQRYVVINQPVTLHAGILELSASQAAGRTSALADMGDGFYQILAPVQFKVGETIGFDGDINKSLMESLDIPKPAKKGRR